MGFIFELLLFIILCVIFVAFSLKKDKKKAEQLILYLREKGFTPTGKSDVADMQNSGKPYKFLVDFDSKKWVYAKYRAETSDIYDFSDITDYRVVLRSKGTNIFVGEKSVIEADPTAGCGILKTQNLTGDNCDYIAIELEFKGKASDQVNSVWVMYENSESNSAVRHSDFLFSDRCIDSAIHLEQWLHEILRENSRVCV